MQPGRTRPPLLSTSVSTINHHYHHGATKARHRTASGLLAVSLVVAGCASTPDPTEPVRHIDSEGAPSRGTTTQDSMTQQLDIQAVQYSAANLSAHRISSFDAVLPSSQQEYLDTGGSALLLVSVITPSKSELPLAKAYVLADGVTHDLQEVATQMIQLPPTSAAARSVGIFREDVFYLLPVKLALSQGVILVDFAKNRSGFTIGSLPISADGNVQTGVVSRPGNANAIRGFLEREYSGFNLEYDPAYAAAH